MIFGHAMAAINLDTKLETMKREYLVKANDKFYEKADLETERR